MSEKRIAEAAEKWGLEAGQLKALVEMFSSAPWGLVEEAFEQVESQGERELLSSSEMIPLGRAQGKVNAVRSIRERLRRYMESYKEAMRDGSEG